MILVLVFFEINMTENDKLKMIFGIQPFSKKKYKNASVILTFINLLKFQHI